MLYELQKKGNQGGIGMCGEYHERASDQKTANLCQGLDGAKELIKMEHELKVLATALKRGWFQLPGREAFYIRQSKIRKLIWCFSLRMM